MLALSFLAYYSVIAIISSALRLDPGGTIKLTYAAYCVVLAPLLTSSAALLSRGRIWSACLRTSRVGSGNLWGWGVLVGLLGAAGNFLIFLMVSAMARLLTGRHITPTDVLTLSHLRGPWLLLAFFSALLIAPFCEEIFFRGVLYASMRRRWGPRAATLVSAAIFSLLHLKWEGLPSLFFLGTLFALLYERSGSLLPVMVAHSLNNLLALAIIMSW